MNKYIKLGLGIIGFVILMGGAYMAYNALTAGQGKADNLEARKETQMQESETTETTNAIETIETIETTKTTETAEIAESEVKETSQESEIEKETQEEVVSWPAETPDFTVYTKDGTAVSLSSNLGKPVVVNFWASWCPPCKAELPDFQSAYETYGDVVFMMVNMTDGYQETQEKGAAYMSENGYTMPVYFDTAQSAAYAYSVNSIPQTYFIDKNGNIAASAMGMIDAETLKKGIEDYILE